MRQGQRRVVISCECGTIAKCYAAARCGRDRRHNVNANCPTTTIVVECALVLPDHGYIDVRELQDRVAS